MYETIFSNNTASGQGDDVYSPTTFVCVDSCPAVTVPDFQCCTRSPSMAPTGAPTSTPSVTVCTDSPYNMDSSKTSDDLNGVLASWSNVSCTGTIVFTDSGATYQLNDSTIIVNGSDWTLDAR